MESTDWRIVALLFCVLPSIASCGDKEETQVELAQAPILAARPQETETDYRLAKVMQHGSGKEIDGRLPICAAPYKLSCTTGKYLVPEDEVLAGTRQGAFFRIDYVNAVGESSQGWVDVNRLEVLKSDDDDRAGWAGRWQSDSKDILIRKTEAARLWTARGYGTYGTDDPVRIRRGTMSAGEFEAKFEVKSNRASFAVGNGDEDGPGYAFKGMYGDRQKTLPYDIGSSSLCRLRLRWIGPYLIASDNMACGGANFSFRGIYRKMKDERHVTNRFNRITFEGLSEPTW